jgi:hypothetical protein
MALDGGATLLYGTYADGSNDKSGAQGVFTALYANDARTSYSSVSFASFDHFFDYLPDRREERIESRPPGHERESRVLVDLQPPIPLNGGYVLVGEAYRPERDADFIPAGTTVDVLGADVGIESQLWIYELGYRYTHAFAAGFDSEGHRLWDLAMPLDVLEESPTVHVGVRAEGDSVSIAWYRDGRVQTVVADAGGAHAQTADASLPADVRQTVGAHAEWWYGDVFLLWGQEQIGEQDGGRHTVFAMTKVAAH